MALFLASAGLMAQSIPDLHLAGEHLEKAGKQRTMALSVALGASLVAVGAIISSEGDKDAMRPGIAIGGAGAIFAIGMNFGANGHEKKAGRILREL